jgi:hypothetical protein
MSDPELEAMAKILSALGDLEMPARTRVIRWINEKFEVLPPINPAARQDFRLARGSSEKLVGAADDGGAEGFDVSLASHIRAKCPDGSQLQRFLATSDWLRRRGQSLTSGAVAKALVDNQQPRLANPADCLNKNVGKGFCEKTKEGFFITPEGLRELGYS